jgi:superfamily I DNA/RNA helicase
MGSKRAGALRSGARIGAFETTEDQTAEPSKVLLDTIRRFKGLERPVVVLTGIDDLSPEEETALLYVGLSRARVHLVVIAKDETMTRLGLAERA